MKVKAFLMALVLFYGIFLGANEPKKLIFAPLPTSDAQSIFQTFSPMVNYLEKTLHVKIEFHFSKSYAEFLTSLKNGEIDLAYLGPLPYVELGEIYPYIEPLVFFNESNGKPFYTCSLIAWGDAYEPLTKLNSYHSFALTDPLSTCGYFGVWGLLNQAGHNLDDQPFVYIGNHDSVALSVVKGRFDYGGVKSDIASKYAHLGIEVVAKTEPIPAFTLIADTQRVSFELRQALAKVLIGVPLKERLEWGKTIKHGCSLAEDKAFDSMRIMQLERIVKQKGSLQ